MHTYKVLSLMDYFMAIRLQGLRAERASHAKGTGPRSQRPSRTVSAANY